jgi:hypothetical protein
MGILNTVFCFQTNPLDIMLPGHRMLYRADGYMNGISLYLIYRDMLFPGGFCCAGYQSLHFLTATVDRNAFVPNHSYDIAAVPANQKFLFHFIPSL